MKTNILTPKETAILKMLPHWKKDMEWLKLNHRQIYDKVSKNLLRQKNKKANKVQRKT